jgi:hypothetical protein
MAASEGVVEVGLLRAAVEHRLRDLDEVRRGRRRGDRVERGEPQQLRVAEVVVAAAVRLLRPDVEQERVRVQPAR